MSKIILEFSPEACRMMACLGHAANLKYPDNDLVLEILDELRVQTNIVHKDPAEHGIGHITTNTNKNKITSMSDMAMSLDYSFLGVGAAEGYYE